MMRRRGENLQRECAFRPRPAGLPRERNADERALLLHVIGEATLLVIIRQQPPSGLGGNETAESITQRPLHLPGELRAPATNVAIGCDKSIPDEKVLATNAANTIYP